jgi:hypothetical protein
MIVDHCYEIEEASVVLKEKRYESSLSEAKIKTKKMENCILKIRMIYLLTLQIIPNCMVEKKVFPLNSLFRKGKKKFYSLQSRI